MNTKQQSLYEWAANTRINPTSDEYNRYIESLHTCLTIIEAQPGYADALKQGRGKIQILVTLLSGLNRTPRAMDYTRISNQVNRPGSLAYQADALTVSDVLDHLDSNHDARDVFRWILTGKDDADGITDSLPREVREYIRHGATNHWNPIR